MFKKYRPTTPTLWIQSVNGPKIRNERLVQAKANGLRVHGAEKYNSQGFLFVSSQDLCSRPLAIKGLPFTSLASSDSFVDLPISVPKFTVNGEISNPKNYFFLEPKQSNMPLVTAITEGKFVMFYGHRGSGKSTRCFYAIANQLPSDFQCIRVSLQAGIDVRNFWPTFGRRINQQASFKKLESTVSITDAASFIDFFAEQRQLKHRIVLFIDEFDLLLQDAAKESLASLLAALRSMKPERNMYALQACVIVGPLSILHAPINISSPFNVSDAIQAPYFTKEEVTTLFKQFEAKTGKKLEEGIVEDVFSRTQGHPGLTCFCGKQLDENIGYGKNEVQLSEWIDYAIFGLPQAISFAWATVGRLQQVVMEPTNSKFLIDYFLHSEGPIFFSTRRRIKYCIHPCSGRSTIPSEGPDILHSFSTNSYTCIEFSGKSTGATAFQVPCGEWCP